MRALSLFSGIGGFELGLSSAGFDIAASVEIDQAASAVLRRHWPEVELHSDVREVGPGTVEAVDLVCGGFPCQDLSVAGRRAGLGGERSGLWWEFHRVLSELRPRWCIVENVPGLLSSNGGRDMGAILWSLGQLGYGYAYRVLDARFFGLAQRRRRVLIVGCLGDGRRAAQVLLEPEGLRGDPAARGEAREDIAGTLGGVSPGGGWRGDLDSSGAFVTALDLRNTGSGGNIDWRDGSEGSVTLDTSGNVGVAVSRAVSTRMERQDASVETFVVADSLRASSGKSTSSNQQLVAAYDRASITSATNRSNQAPGDPAPTLHSEAPLLASTLTSGGHPNSNAPGRRHEDDENPVAWQCHGTNVGPLGALRAGNGNETGGVPFLADPICANEQRTTSHAGNNPRPRNVVPGAVGVRRLTPTECERLQGFPDGWTAGQSDAARYRQLGNAFPPPMAEWIGRRILAVEDAFPVDRQPAAALPSEP